MAAAVSLIRPPRRWEALLRKAFKGENFQYDFEYLPEPGPGSLKQASAVIAASLTEEQLKEAENLRLLQVPFAGTDRIDLKLMKKRGIIVSNSHENASSVAEHGMLLLLSLTKNLVNQDKDLRRGLWHGWVARKPNAEARGKTLGIIGLGSIGREMARRAKSFDMRVIGTKADPQKDADKLAGIVDAIHSSAELDSVIKKAHYLFVSVPLSKTTEGLIGESQLQRMKGKYLINVSRGEIVDEGALYAALAKNVLKGAAIDTWYLYPEEGKFAFPSRYPFHELPNVVMTPHAAGFTKESAMRNWLFSFRNIAGFFRDGRAENVVNR
ncbi:MAG: hydroxyacid dehydrogenase [Desulfobacteraceae bacterium]|nr:MAG: hydroxyacid dehydrogenase [Desulfobacteraceae bacterium]